METDTAIAPAYWASYLINGDSSGISKEDKEQCDKWIDILGQEGWSVVSCTDDEPYFSRYNDAHTGLAGDVMVYVLHKRM